MASIKEKQVLDSHIVRLNNVLNDVRLKPNYQPYIAKLESAIVKLEFIKNK